MDLPRLDTLDLGKTIYADLGVAFDNGETIHILLWSVHPGGLKVPARWLVMPRSGFMLSLADAAGQFLPGLSTLDALLN